MAAFRVHFRLHFLYDTLNVAVYVTGIELDVLHVIRCFVLAWYLSFFYSVFSQLWFQTDFDFINKILNF